MIRDVQSGDAAEIVEIYNHYIEETVITFELEPISSQVMLERINKVLAANLPWLVIEEGGKILGYCYATPWKERSAYRYSVEVTVYLSLNAKRKGFGSQLYVALFEQLKVKGFHRAMGGVTLPNEASVVLHENMGMTKVAHFAQVGYKFEQWLDVGYWQKEL